MYNDSTSVYVIIPIVPCAAGKQLFASSLERKMKHEGFQYSKISNQEIKDQQLKLFLSEKERVKRENAVSKIFQEKLKKMFSKANMSIRNIILFILIKNILQMVGQKLAKL